MNSKIQDIRDCLSMIQQDSHRHPNHLVPKNVYVQHMKELGGIPRGGDEAMVTAKVYLSEVTRALNEWDAKRNH